MSSPTTPTFDLPTPRRPGIDDVGGGAKLDDQSDPPDPVTMPTAADENQQENLIVKACGIVPVLEGSVHFSGGVPAVNQVASMAAVVDILLMPVTDNGPGDTSITWPGTWFPTEIVDPEAYITGATPGMIACEKISNGVRVRTLNSAGVATDLPFNFKRF